MKKKINHQKGQMGFGLEVLIFVIIVFIIWILAGGAQKPRETNPLIENPTEKVETKTPFNN